ncbi:MAG: HU family DNA-binding protein [Prevotellaceae bacterium]|nr:HU family DNA-binding protein [Prevotellaceae bacterium]
MAVKYRLFQEQRKTSPNKGKWYARAVINDVVALEEISQEIQDNTTAKQADVYAVLKELVNVMGRHLRNGDKVVLDGFGSFKVGLKTTAAATAKEFSPAKNITGARLNFQPETHWTATDKTRRKQFIQGLEVRMVGEKDTPDGGGTSGGDNPGGGTGLP